jgi:hypothetical protein
MRLQHTYNQRFEDETKGYNYIRRVTPLVGIICTFVTIIFIMSALILLSTTNKSHTDSSSITNLQSIRKKADPISTFVPTCLPSNMQFEDREYDDDDTIRRKSKYPTHHPKKNKPTTGNTLFPVNIDDTYFPVNADNTLVPLSIDDTLFPVNIDDTYFPIIGVNDDFHVTPIVVINTETKKEKNE